MEIAEYKNIYQHETSHFFYVAVHRLITLLVSTYGPKGTKKILDAGCGTGGLAARLKRKNEVIGIDISPEAIKLAKKRRVRAVLASITKIPFRAREFDVVTSVDVIYHRLVNDQQALREFHRVLKPNGVLILRVPADKKLASAHDRFVHTRERYDKNELTKKLRATGFKIELITYIHSPLWPLAKFQVWREHKKGDEVKSGVTAIPKLINQILIFILNREADLILSGFRPKRGIGLVAVARRIN